jgi:hypothetical protein
MILQGQAKHIIQLMKRYQLFIRFKRYFKRNYSERTGIKRKIPISNEKIERK